MSAGLNGMSASIKGMKQAAQEVAELNLNPSVPDYGAPGEVEDAIESLTSLKLYSRQVQASAKVVETADEMMGFLLDVRA